MENQTLEARGGKCQFPTDAGLVAVTPNEKNAGWAMSPDQPCKPGNYCPYACPPGQVSMQWDPEATSYSYPMSMVRYETGGRCIHLSYARAGQMPYGEGRSLVLTAGLLEWRSVL